MAQPVLDRAAVDDTAFRAVRLSILAVEVPAAHESRADDVAHLAGRGDLQVEVLHLRPRLEGRIGPEGDPVTHDRAPAAVADVRLGGWRRERRDAAGARGLRIEGNRRRQEVARPDGGVDLGPRQRGGDAAVLLARQGFVRDPAVAVVERLRKPHAAPLDRPADPGVRLPGVDAADAALGQPEARGEAVDGHAKLIASPARLHGGHARCRAAELSRRRVWIHSHRIDRVERQVRRKLPGDRIGFPGAVDEQRALRRTRAGHADEAVRPSHHARHERQDVVVAAVGEDRLLDDRLIHGGGFAGFGRRQHGLRLCRHGHFLAHAAERQDRIAECHRVRPDDDACPRLRLEAGELELDRVPPGRNVHAVRPVSVGRYHLRPILPIRLNSHRHTRQRQA